MSERQAGFYPFRGPDASCTQIEMLQFAGLDVKLARAQRQDTRCTAGRRSVGGRYTQT
jgi:hypothetical protein